MIKQISLIAIVAIGIGVLFLGTSHVPAFAQNVPPSQNPGCTGDPHGGVNPETGNPHGPGTGGAGGGGGETGNPHVPGTGTATGEC